tara:strand:- start:368 stop:583 length:216 start_codon:yes stop_codon:yes gene_type:complete
MYEVTEESLDFMPLLKQQLITFIGVNYEENADYSNHSLVQEYHYLERNNLLGYLPNAEYLTNKFRLEIDFS